MEMFNAECIGRLGSWEQLHFCGEQQAWVMVAATLENDRQLLFVL
jgi:hypothetical protein